ncbi:MAG: protein adenylyltransferase SelO family protein, partial [Bdellovibrionales bacterium]|nr:protein adenylyltransferase SelO family protein [Bdellovibrionales bacterium]
GDVYREEVEKEAIVLRVAESFLRFGHFQYYAHSEQNDVVKDLCDFVIENYYPDFKDRPNAYVLLFQEVTKRTAKLFSYWQSVGFCHGVLNTDNMSILGLTLDYGPYGFIDNFDQDFICNHSDHEGRYSLGNQPSIGLWNLQALAEAINPLLTEEEKKRTLETYPQIFFVHYRKLLLDKCGLYTNQLEDEDFLRGTLNMLVFTKLDYTNFFRALSRYNHKSGKIPNIEDSESLKTWLTSYDERLGLESVSESERHIRMLEVNPKFVLRNYVAQIAIDDPKLVPIIFDILTHPFDEWNEYEEWSRPAPKKYKNLTVSCSS